MTSVNTNVGAQVASANIEKISKEGEKVVDIYSLMQDPTFWLSVNRAAAKTIDTEIGGANFTHVACIESSGFVQGSYLATHFGKPFVPIKKVNFLRQGNDGEDVYEKQFIIENDNLFH